MHDSANIRLRRSDDAPAASCARFVPRNVFAALMVAGQMARPASAKRRESLVGLDLMRGLAAFAVFFDHIRSHSFVDYGSLPAAQKGVPTAIVFAITRMGFEGVLVFFVLSGYLVGGQVIRLVQKRDFDVRGYAIDRATRILLPLIPACLVTVAIGWGFFGQPLHLWQAVLNMVGLNGVLTDTLEYNAPLWSLAFEIWFYVLAGAVGCLFGEYRRSAIALIVTAVGITIFCVLPARFILYWFMGAVCVLIPCRARAANFGLGGLVLCLLGGLASQLNFKSAAIPDITLLPQPIAEALFSFGVCLLIIFLCNPAINSALRIVRRPALYMSTISYTLYLFHAPLDAALGRVFPKADNIAWSSIGFFSIRVILLLVMLNLIYFAFEAHTGRVRRVLKAALLLDQK
jgi:peptidoglycan/LPS O-acetylase OafA/YrhL